MSELTPWSLATFVRSIALLAAAAQDQIDWLDSLKAVGTLTDELALEWHEGYLRSPQFLENGWLRPETGEKLDAINDLLNRMSGPAEPDLWRQPALSTDPRWEELRVLARRALFSI